MKYSFWFEYSRPLRFNVAGDERAPAQTFFDMHSNLMYFSLRVELVSISNAIIQYLLWWRYCYVNRERYNAPMSSSIESCDVNKQITHFRLKWKCKLDNAIPVKEWQTESDASAWIWAKMRVAHLKYVFFAFLFIWAYTKRAYTSNWLDQEFTEW